MNKFLRKIKELPLEDAGRSKKNIFGNLRSRFGTVAFPGWLFVLLMTLFCEVIVHLWVADGFSFGRFAAVAAFALGFGCLLSTVVSFFGRKIDKWVALVIGFALVVLYLVEYFISQAYQVFMPLASVLNGAKGVATDFADIVINVVVQGMWRILLFLLPLVLFGLFARSVKTSWRTRWFLTVGILVCYLLGYGVVQRVGVDASRLSSTYEFDSAVRVFGLNTALGLDALHSGTELEEEGGGFAVQTPPPVVQPVQPQETQPQVEETQPEVVYEPQTMGFDYAAMAEKEPHKRIRAIHNYVGSLTPEMTNEYTGLFAGKNLIVVCAEGFAKEVIDPELTPTLYRLATKGIQFHDFYQPMWGGSTSSGEFSVLTGLVSASGTNSVRESIQQDLFLTYAKQLDAQGYNTFAYHNHLHTFYDRHETHPEFGYETYMGLGNGMEEGVKEQWPESDLEMIDFTVPQFIDKQPFHVYYMTVSGHCRYNKLGNKMSGKNYDVVKDLPYSETVKCYIAANLELEYAMASLVKQLEDAGIADDTVIVLCADHYPYGLERGSTYNNKEDYIGELYGKKYDTIIERDHNALIIWSGSIEDMGLEVHTPTYSLDILPTISNLFGWDYDSRLLVGRDVFSDAEPIVLWYNHTWKTEYGYYDSNKGKFYPNEGVTVDADYVERIKTIVSNKIFYSREVQATDYFDYLSAERKSWSQ